MSKMIYRMLEQLKEIFEEREIKYQCDEEEYIRAPFESFMLVFRVTERSVALRLQMREEVPEEHKIRMLRFLNRINMCTKEGHWEIQGNGKVSFRIYVDLPETGYMEKLRMEHMLEKAMKEVTMFGCGVKMIMEGTEKEDLFDYCIGRTLKAQED